MQINTQYVICAYKYYTATRYRLIEQLFARFQHNTDCNTRKRTRPTSD